MLYNRTRELLFKLYETRKADNPPISGSEIMEVLNAGFRMPRNKYNEFLERLLDEIESCNRRINSAVRLMISGSPLNNPEFLKVMEDEGGLVVIDELCTSSSYWLDPIDTSYPNPLEAISYRYLNKFPCARMVPYDNRFDKIFELVREYQVDGMVAQLIRHCAPYSQDQPLLREKLEAMGIPVLELDVEYGMGGTGQIKTRVQAFLELLMSKKTKDLS
jgi:benzoyl-CoA reductase/2-hydroxyglutaryl-CoA dehydratase subunit BcrC/BadD/HgdB